MKTLEELIAEIEEKFPNLQWLVRRDLETSSYFANIYNGFDRVSYPTFGPDMISTLEACLSRAKESVISGVLPNQILRL